MGLRRRAQVDWPKDRRNRDHQKRDHGQKPEHVDIGEIVDLLLERLTNPGQRL